MVGVYSTAMFGRSTEHPRSFMRQHCFNHSERLYSEDSSKLDQGDTGHMIWDRPIQARRWAESRSHYSESSLANHLVSTVPGAKHDTEEPSGYWLHKPTGGESESGGRLSAAIHARDPPYTRTGGPAPGGVAGEPTRSSLGSALEIRGQRDVWSDPLRGAHDTAQKEHTETELSDPERGVKPSALRLRLDDRERDLQRRINLKLPGWDLQLNDDSRSSTEANTRTSVAGRTQKWGYGQHYTVDTNTTDGYTDLTAEQKTQAVRSTQERVLAQNERLGERWVHDTAHRRGVAPAELPWKPYGRQAGLGEGSLYEKFDSIQGPLGTVIEESAKVRLERALNKGRPQVVHLGCS
eukprot:TRINITY_DN14108_c0_g1_i5.p1 TRINITY_DN14108_c0_g1~~TRINITY_DN14108_c0_g1_i5.p1  ORF type:complete len:351 (+),score=64.62 TRINITY_DN14108_c0_g1_i5:197-1249(+)